MTSNQVDERVLAKLKVKVLKAEEDNVKTQEKKPSDMVDYIYNAIKTEVRKSTK